MSLFKGDTIKKVNKLIEKGSERKEKLLAKIEELKMESEALYQAEQDDFNEAILNDTEPNMKLRDDRLKLQRELQIAKEMLSLIDSVIQDELEKAKDDVEKERKQYDSDKAKEFNVMFAELNDLKLAYLNKLVEYSKAKSKYTVDYRNKFEDVHKKVGLKLPDTFYSFKLNVHRQRQDDGLYSPLIFKDELLAILENQSLSPVTAKNKDAFKK
ncbi:hypothetical protein EVJ24_15020 [Exiguobacterium sp. SH1S21]|uniref:hypothetical protein n=1 Tax=Exiguobacterium sp. SH1S21 TaxID=2510953 RepID=UPI00103A191F|nr:hypothetical protein [Exiguobacterium sp. SH1S21]TCI50317.1 hypothetical protein EVJ24_15020 [Exiguobacterium sp. SH1S21]